MDELFIDSEGKSYSRDDVSKALKEIGADDCGTLFLHSDVTFGRPPANFKRREYLGALWEVLCGLGVENIIAPAFTYSFCNNEDYDVRSSRTSMGALNEYIRKLEGRYRTLDPLLSVSVPENLKAYFEDLGNHSLGKDSAFDVIHSGKITNGNIKFLFLGADFANCFTYLHYIEKMMNVPYNFDMRFEGNVTDENGTVSRRTQYISTKCFGIQLPDRYGYFEDWLIERGMLRKTRLGDGVVSCITEADAFSAITAKLTENINYFLVRPFTEADLIHKYTYDPAVERVTHC